LIPATSDPANNFQQWWPHTTTTNQRFSIHSLLSLDIQDFLISQGSKFNQDTGKNNFRYNHVSNWKKIAKQQEIINTQGLRIEGILKIIQEMKDITESKIDKLIQIVSELTTYQDKKDSKKEENTIVGGSVNKWRP
jgi:hypothetical protein